jgi:hypothetical protein
MQNTTIGIRRGVRRNLLRLWEEKSHWRSLCGFKYDSDFSINSSLSYYLHKGFGLFIALVLSSNLSPGPVAVELAAGSVFSTVLPS